MKIKLCQYFWNGDELELRSYPISKFSPKTKDERRFVDTLKLLEVNPSFEEKISNIRKKYGINSKVQKESFDSNPFEFYDALLGEDKRKKLSREVIQMTKEMGLPSLGMSMFFFVTTNALMVPFLDPISVFWQEPTDYNFPNYASGGVVILIKKRMNSTELSKEIREKFSEIQQLMDENKLWEGIPSIGFRDVNESLKLLKLRKKKVSYEELSNIFHAEAHSLAEKVSNINRKFIRKT